MAWERWCHERPSPGAGCVTFGLALALALLFAFTNGIHDASNAIAALVATRGARPLQAVLLAAVFNLLGPLLVGTAVADTIGGIVTAGGAAGVEMIGAGLLAAVLWNLATWALGLPSSAGHALVGGLVGAALVAGGGDASGGAASRMATRWASSARSRRWPSRRHWARSGGSWRSAVSGARRAERPAAGAARRVAVPGGWRRRWHSATARTTPRSPSA
jgi:Phosphate transporter family